MPGRLLLAQPGEALALPFDVVGERRRRVEVEGQPAVAGVAGEEQASLDQQRLVAGRVPGVGTTTTEPSPKRSCSPSSI